MTELDWAMRTEAYRFFVEHARAPNKDELAYRFAIPAEDVIASLRRLHRAHALFLRPDSGAIRMLNPFSAVPTGYIVKVGDRSYFANCAWDMLAIPAMLGKDALIHARLEGADTAVQIPVIDGVPQPDGDYVVNYSVPFRAWYDDLIHT